MSERNDGFNQETGDCTRISGQGHSVRWSVSLSHLTAVPTWRLSMAGIAWRS